MCSLDAGIGSFERKPQPLTVESLTQVGNLFEDAKDEFDRSAPDFSAIEICIKNIRQEIHYYEEDFTIILSEKEQYGGGLEKNRNRIENMKKTIPALESMIIEAESIIASNELLYGPYRAQIDAAKKIIEVLKKI